MKLRLPLFAQILGWFFLNLALLAGVVVFVARSNGNFGLDSALLSQGEARVQALVDLVAAELRERPSAEWDQILRRYSVAYRLDVRLHDNVHGEWLAGTNAPLPASVLAQITERPPDRGGPHRDDRPPGFDGPPEAGGYDSPPLNVNPVGQVRSSPGKSPKFLVRTTQSPRYWLLARMMLHPADGPRMPVTLVAASDALGFNGLLADFRPLFVALGAAALLSALFWLPFVRRITGTVGKMKGTAQEIAEGRFDARVPAQRADELGDLSVAINSMAERLDGYVSGQKRFMGDVAHELCAPIARIQMALGILEQRADEKQKAYVEDLREEVQHMSNLVNELLSFTKASLKPGEIKLAAVRIKPLAELAARREAPAPGAVSLQVPGNLAVMANADLLLRAISNLLRNAVRYAGQSGPVIIAASRKGKHIEIVVADHGPGIPEQHLGHIFDTFYRIEPDRGRETGGVGLGLAIVKSCVQSCNGSVRARNRRRGGLKVTLSLPIAELPGPAGENSLDISGASAEISGAAEFDSASAVRPRPTHS